MRVLTFVARDEMGAVVRLLDEETNLVLEVSHVPKKLFQYPIYLQVPPEFEIKYDAHLHGGKLFRSLSYVILVKARNKAEFYSKGNMYFEPPNKLKELFPHVALKLEL